MSEKRERNIGIDLFRLIAMLMVVTLHVLQHGGALEHATGINKEILRMLQALAICSVNGYVLISGYVGGASRQKWSNLAILWLQVLVYSAGITVAAWLIFPGKITKDMLFSAFFPVMTKQYWFFTAYTGMFILSPLCNYVVQGMKKADLQRMIVMVLIAFSVNSLFFKNDVFLTNGGFSVLWFLVVYLIGAYIKQYGLWDRWPTYGWVLVYIGATLAMWGIQKFSLSVNNESAWPGLILSYSSPTVLMAAIALLQVFSRVRVNGWIAKCVGFLAPAAFGVYLIHEHDIVRAVLIQDRFVLFGQYSTLLMVALVLVAVLAIFFGCLVLDLLRNQVFKWLRIKLVLQKLETKLTTPKSKE